MSSGTAHSALVYFKLLETAFIFYSDVKILGQGHLYLPVKLGYIHCTSIQSQWFSVAMPQ